MNGDGRPDPDELLERYALRSNSEDGARGRLRVILGAAPGVGKSYQMLNEGRRLAAEGHDVVIGFVETHGRPDTAAQIGSLQVVPRKSIDYRGKQFDELDLAAILARRPEIVLIDELAHTNIPGAGNEKRWMDVEAIRDAGIDVIATLNVQHLESLNATVDAITGVTVRETVPDKVLTGATEVQLVDLPPGALIDRLREGKVYEPAQAQQALQGFFREGNLTALRELALRHTAATVDDQLEDYMRGNEIEAVWGAAERILVLLDPILPSQHAIRSAWRLAAGQRAELLALATIQPGDAHARERLRPSIRLAEDLGADVRIIESNDGIAAIAKLARDVNASTIVIAYRPERGWRSRLEPSFIDRLFEALDGVDLHLVESRGQR